jgi:DAK2 domain fusion protein YloV
MDHETVAPPVPPVRIPTRCDAPQLHAAVVTAAAWLKLHAAEVDALNVYPVPDGDTGSNMSETLAAAIVEAGAAVESQAGQYAARLAHGALMGARGNSGVILSQLFRGFARSLAETRTMTAADLAAALQEASATAYRAVMRPVEGTILTVARLAAEEAVRAAAEQPDFSHVLGVAVSAARRALAETRNQLPALRQAGVVDAGGRGYLLILEGALRHVQGRPALEEPAMPAPQARAQAAEHARFDHLGHAWDGRHAYCTEFLIAGDSLEERAVRQALAPLGDSLLVVGDERLLRVHLHTDDPGRALSYATGVGRLRGVKIEDMQAQHTVFASEVPPSLVPHAPDFGAVLPIGVVTVASGAGFTALFSSLGAQVVPGGQTMNPSTEQILAAIRRCPQQTIIVLPNNGNVLAAAQQAASLSGDRLVHVVPTQTVPQGIAALLAIRYDEESAQILAAMDAARHHVRTAELTVAVRDVAIDNVPVRRGDVLGLLDGVLVMAGEDQGSVATALLDTLPVTAYELVTVYTGEAVSEETAGQFVDLLRRRYPEVRVELLPGGQPHYQYVISAE